MTGFEPLRLSKYQRPPIVGRYKKLSNICLTLLKVYLVENPVDAEDFVAVYCTYRKIKTLVLKDLKNTIIKAMNSIK